MAVKPVVDGIEREHPDRLVVVRVNVQDPAGKVLGDRFGAVYTPTFLLFDSDGEIAWRRVGAIDPAEVRRFLAP
ncbi:MAG: thioredoxin family protein [Anaerolineales bacterium]